MLVHFSYRQILGSELDVDIDILSYKLHRDDLIVCSTKK